MSKANPPFQVDSPPYPRDLPFYQTEALSWLLDNKNKAALAGNRFQTTADAIEAVKSLYAAGATQVNVGVPYDEPERIEKEGGPYADALHIVCPREKTKDVLAVVKSLRPDAGGKADEVLEEDSEHSLLMLWWD